MKGTWLDGLRDRWRSVWDVLTGRAYAAYSVPDIMDEVRLRIAVTNLLAELEDEGCSCWGAVADVKAALGSHT